MLTRLSIRDIVLIDRLDLDFGTGLSVMTGETGAGKSILLDSLGLALGRRADAKLVRPGAERASVSGEFSLPGNHAAFRVLQDHDVPIDEPGVLLVRRVIGSDGRSRAYINDEPVGVAVLRQVGETLVEIQGQFDQHGLMDPATHLDLLDAYANAGPDRETTSNAFEAWRTARKALADARANAEAAKQEEDRLRFMASELDRLAPKVGEEADLSSRRTFLRNAEKLSDAISTARAALEDEEGAENAIAQAMRALERTAGEAQDRFDQTLDALGRAAVELEEALGSLNRISEDLSPDTGSLEDVEERLFALKDLARKYSVESDGLPDLREDVARRLDLLEGNEDIFATLEVRTVAARGDFVAAAERLSAVRKRASRALDMAVNKELPPLRLEKARFETRIEALDEPNWSALGWDRAAFVVATNPGMPPGALDKIASGGELSRFLLAIKLALAEKESVPSLVFDEVDSGIGGATAAAVGERLERLATTLQILVVTHSPQVAARGAVHLRVVKSMHGEIMATDVTQLDHSDRLEEVARMLAGAEISEEARAAARRLIDGNKQSPNRPIEETA